MTQPIQEPTTPRSVSRLTWGENQLYRRPAPAPSGGTSACLLTNLDFITSSANLVVPADTWEVAASAGQGRKFYDGWYIDDSPAWDLDGVNGEIGREEDALYVAYARVRFSDATAGDIVGLAVAFNGASGGGDFYENVIVVSGDEGVTISVPWWGQIPYAAAARMWVYCNPSLTLGGGCEFHLRRFELTSAGFTDTF